MASLPPRDPIAAGVFYPSDARELEREVQALLRGARNQLEPERRLKAVACPHGRYAHSGAVAAEAHACLKGRKINTVVIVGPDHYVGFEGIAVYPEGSFRTPLGEVHVDEELAQLFIDHGDSVRAAPEAHTREHAIEVQLPFLQTALPGAAIVPVLLGFRSRSNVEILATLLSQALDREDVLLMSTTDLSHYHTPEEARKLDGRVQELVRAFAPTILWDDLQKGNVEMCGGDSLVSVMLGAGIAGAEASRVLAYGNNGEAHTVGYLSAAFYRGGPPTKIAFEAHESAYAPTALEKVEQ